MRERDFNICKVEIPMYERYDKAVENNDAEELAWFAQWLENGNCMSLKDKSEHVQVFKDGTFNAEIMLLQHPNGKWIGTLCYSLSICGGGSYPSIWEKQYDTRRNALNATLDKLIGYVESSTVQKDRKYLPLIKKMRASTGQLSLFDDF